MIMKCCRGGGCCGSDGAEDDVDDALTLLGLVVLVGDGRRTGCLLHCGAGAAVLQLGCVMLPRAIATNSSSR